MHVTSLATILIPCVCGLLAPSSALAGSAPLTATELHLLELDENGDLVQFVRIDAPADYEWTPLGTIQTAVVEADERHGVVRSKELSQAGTPSSRSDEGASTPTMGWGDLEDQPLPLAGDASAVTTQSADARLTVVPEPSLPALALLGGAALVTTGRYLRRLYWETAPPQRR